MLILTLGSFYLKHFKILLKYNNLVTNSVEIRILVSSGFQNLVQKSGMSAKYGL